MVGSNAKSVEIIFNAIDRTKGIFKGIDKSFGKIERSIDRVNKDLKSMGTSLQEVGMAATAIGTAIVFPFVGAIKKAGQFEKSMSRVKAVSGATEREFKKLTKTALELGRTTTYTASQAAEGFQFLAMAGIKAGDAIEALPSVLQLAQAGAMDLGTAADITTNILTAYRFEVEDLGHVNDVLVKAFISSNTTLMELGEGFKFVGPIARGLGTKFEDVIAVMGKLADAGIKASVAGTTLRGTISALFNPTGEEEKLMAALSDRIGGVGLQIRDSEGDFVGFGELIYQLEQASIKADEALKLFGLRAGPGIAALLGVGSKAIKEFTEELDNADGTSKKISKVMTDNFLGAVTRLTSAFDGLSISIGTPFLNDLAGVTDGLAATILVLTELHDAFGPVATGIDFIVVSIASLLVALAAIGVSVKFIIKPLTLFIQKIGAGGLLLALSRARAAVVALGASLGPAGLAFLASIGAYNIGKLVQVLLKLRKQAKAITEAERQIEEGADKSSAKLRKLATRLDLVIKDMSAFNKLVQTNQIVFDKVTKKWKLAANSIKVINDRLTKSIQDLKDTALSALKGFSYASDMLAIQAQKRLLEIRQQQLDKPGGTEEEAKLLREESAVLEAEERLALMNRTFELVKEVYGKETDEYKAALQEKLRAENAFVEAKLIIGESANAKRIENEQKQLKLISATAQAEFKTFFIYTDEMLSNLTAAYKRGEVSIRDYFRVRQDLISRQYQMEQDELGDLIATSTDEMEIIAAKTALLKSESEERQRKIALIDEEDQALQQKNSTGEISGPMPRYSGGGGKELSATDKYLNQEWYEGSKQGPVGFVQKKWYEGAKYGPEDKMQLLSDACDQTSTMFGTLSEEADTLTGVFKTAEDTFRIFSDVSDPDYIKNYIKKATDTIHRGIKNTVLELRGKWSSGFASGGLIPGSSPHPKADNISINATAGEFMHSVDTVKHYGLAFMEGIRTKSIPKDVFKGFHLPSFSRLIPKTNFADGGSIVAPAKSSYSVNVPVNVSGFSDELGGRLQQGIEDVVINIMREELA